MSGISMPEGAPVTIMTLQAREAAAIAIAFQAAHRRPRQVAAAEFKSLDPDVISAAIPAFFIGRNEAGLWVAREAGGRVGGLFLFKSSAIDFAKSQSAPAQCALVFPADSFELDIENRGNPLVVLGGHAWRLLAR